MKRLLTTFFLVVYISTAFGVVTSFHYCKGHLTKTSLLNFDGKSGCNCNPQDMPKDCCKDELHYEKADNHTPVHSVSILHLTSISIEPPAETRYNRFSALDGYGSDFIITDVRRTYPEPIYLLNRVFLI